MDKNTQEIIKEATIQLLEKLLIGADVSVNHDDGAYLVTIESAEPGMLIGRHGRNLEAIQVLLGQMIYRSTGVWQRIVVSVGDYRQRRAQQLKEMAEGIAEKVAASKEPMTLSDLTPAERRVVHMALADHVGVVTESEGEGKFRKLVIKPKM